MYKILFYRTKRGDCPFRDFLNDRTEKTQGKFIKMLDLLAGYGPDLLRPYADNLRDGIRELRVKFGSDQYRAFYFFFYEKRIVVTHGIVKKSDEVSVREIDRAVRYRADYLERYHLGEEKL